MNCLLVIPARLASTRLPEKLLRKAGGKSVLQHTYESARRATIADEVVIAVDHERMAAEVDSFGGRWLMTGKDCASGTDRIAEVAEAYPDAEIFINVQGDEPEIDPDIINGVGNLLIRDPSADMATAGVPIRERSQLADPAIVKIVMATEQGRAVYFSRAVVPHCRDGPRRKPTANRTTGLLAPSGTIRVSSLVPAMVCDMSGEPTGENGEARATPRDRSRKNHLGHESLRGITGIDTEEDLKAFIDRLEGRVG